MGTRRWSVTLKELTGGWCAVPLERDLGLRGTVKDADGPGAQLETAGTGHCGEGAGPPRQPLTHLPRCRSTWSAVVRGQEGSRPYQLPGREPCPPDGERQNNREDKAGRASGAGPQLGDSENRPSQALALGLVSRKMGGWGPFEGWQGQSGWNSVTEGREGEMRPEKYQYFLGPT